ncbi:hypothetical protein GCM10022247_34990 [Allokutzneria multivorans]|uniref:Uncharacterized protein n=1 Tax=Allokutzneria multivorans TaxID=1142134 RepID=A0ABP7SCP4_9PSEU
MGGQRQPLAIAGVAGGVGTSTWVRLLQRAEVAATDTGVYHGGELTMLVTNTTAAATRHIGTALWLSPRPPILVVLATSPRDLQGAAKSFVTAAKPHLAYQLALPYERRWAGLVEAPGPGDLRARTRLVLNQLPEALRAFYSQTPRRPAATEAAIARANPRAATPATATGTWARAGPNPLATRPTGHYAGPAPLSASRGR